MSASVSDDARADEATTNGATSQRVDGDDEARGEPGDSPVVHDAPSPADASPLHDTAAAPVARPPAAPRSRRRWPWIVALGLAVLTATALAVALAMTTTSLDDQRQLAQ